jgi:sugar phosphate isomerase/epimerase
MSQAELVNLARQAGCAGVEFRPYWRRIEEEIPKIKQALASNGMVCTYASNEAVVAASREETFQAIHSLQAGLHLAQQLGAKVLRFNAASGPFDPDLVQQAWWAEALKPVIVEAKLLGITLAVENGPDAQKGDPQLFQQIFAALPALRLTYDTGNWLYANTRPEAALDVFLNQIGYVHLKDIICENAGLKHGRPGTGLVNVKGLKERIAASGYVGLFALEFPGGDNPLERVLQSQAYLGE